MAESVELVSGVYALPQTIEHEGVEYSYYPAAVETPRGLTLLDVGHGFAVEQVEANLEDIGYDWSDVSAVVLTHRDSDHVEALSMVADRLDATIYAHERATSHVDGESLLGGEKRYEPVGVDVSVVDGVRFRTDAGPMEVVFTPGHTPDHVSLHFPDADLLVAADAVVAPDSEVILPQVADEETARDSVARLADLDFDRTLCYHGGLVESGTDRLADLAESLR
jgi:glyoxylase-like metal-dependent hydrolase (beta-lactamase superfamily II)